MTPPDHDADTDGGTDADTGGTVSRRRLLVTTGAVGLGAAGVGAASALTAPVEYRHSTVVRAQASGGVSLRVDWTEWYNDQVIERRPAGEGPRPSIALGNVLPGDVGRVALGVRVAGGPGGDGPGSDTPGEGPGNASDARVWVRLRERPGSGAENGINEVERVAGDDTPERGELGEFLDVSLWRDSGIQVGGTPVFGACDGTFDTGDRVLADGSFSDVAVPPDAGSGIEEGGWLPVTDETECLAPGEKLCIGFRWAAGSDNRIQGDGIAFAIEFWGRQCEQ